MRPRGHSAACILSASPLIIESGSLSVALSPEESAGGVAGSVTSTVYATMATNCEWKRSKMGGQLAWICSSEYNEDVRK